MSGYPGKCRVYMALLHGNVCIHVYTHRKCVARYGAAKKTYALIEGGGCTNKCEHYGHMGNNPSMNRNDHDMSIESWSYAGLCGGYIKGGN